MTVRCYCYQITKTGIKLFINLAQVQIGAERSKTKVYNYDPVYTCRVGSSNQFCLSVGWSVGWSARQSVINVP